jgi:hypothetical protein
VILFATRTEEGMEVRNIFIFYRKISDNSTGIDRDSSPSPPQQPPSQGSYSQVSRGETALFSWTPPPLSSMQHGKPFSTVLTKEIHTRFLDRKMSFHYYNVSERV